MRVATLPGAARVASGPYRWLRHPNYAAVALEALALPLAFAAWGTLLLAGALIGVALARRLAIEERALAAAARTVDVSPPGATPSGESTEIA
jgi:methyltransferase